MFAFVGGYVEVYLNLLETCIELCGPPRPTVSGV